MQTTEWIETNIPPGDSKGYGYGMSEKSHAGAGFGDGCGNGGGNGCGNGGGNGGGL